MSTIFWIFGASAVGKKRYINAAIENPGRFRLPTQGLKRMFYADGDPDLSRLIDAVKQSPVIVRWQWGRELLLRSVALYHPQIDQRIRVCKVSPSVQLARVIEREGEAKWDEWSLIREMQDVDALVQRISAAFAIPVLYIDTTREDYTCEFTA